MRVIEKAQRLVSTGIEAAHHNFLAGKGSKEFGVFGLLHVNRWGGGGIEKHELGAKETYALGSTRERGSRFVGSAEVGQQGHAEAVLEGALGDGRARRIQERVAALEGRRHLLRGGIDRNCRGTRIDHNEAAVGNVVGAGNPHDGRNRLSSRQNRGV